MEQFQGLVTAIAGVLETYLPPLLVAAMLWAADWFRSRQKALKVLAASAVDEVDALTAPKVEMDGDAKRRVAARKLAERAGIKVEKAEQMVQAAHDTKKRASLPPGEP